MKLGLAVCVVGVVASCEQINDIPDDEDQLCIAIYRGGESDACTESKSYTLAKGQQQTFNIKIADRIGVIRAGVLEVRRENSPVHHFTCTLSVSNISVPGSASLLVAVSDTPQVGTPVAEPCLVTARSGTFQKTFQLNLSAP